MYFYSFLILFFYAITIRKKHIKSHRSFLREKKCLLFLLILNINEIRNLFNSIRFELSFVFINFFELSTRNKKFYFLRFTMTLKIFFPSLQFQFKYFPQSKNTKKKYFHFHIFNFFKKKVFFSHIVG